MVKRRHYRFANHAYQRVIAHGGNVPILTHRVLQHSDDAFCNFIDLTIVPPGATIGMHTHEIDNEEVYIIISGNGEMIMDGERFEIGPGEVVLNNPGATHGLWNTGEVEIKIVVIEIGGSHNDT